MTKRELDNLISWHAKNMVQAMAREGRAYSPTCRASNKITSDNLCDTISALACLRVALENGAIQESSI